MLSRVISVFLAALAVASASNEVGLKFLEEKAKEADVVALDSGMLYKVRQQVLRLGDKAAALEFAESAAACDPRYEKAHISLAHEREGNLGACSCFLTSGPPQGNGQGPPACWHVLRVPLRGNLD